MATFGVSTAVQAATTPGLNVESIVKPGKILVGEPCWMRITLNWRGAVQVPTLSLPEKLGAFRVLGQETRPDATAPDGSVTRTVIVKLTSFEIGRQELPPVEIPYVDARARSKTAATPRYVVQVESYLAKLPTAEKTPLRPVKPPLFWPVDRRLVLLVVAAGLAALTVLVLLARWLRKRWAGRRREAPPVPLLPPDEEALRALAELEVSGMVERDTAKAYYSRLSEILRRYLGRRYLFDALDMTTSEILGHAEQIGWGDGLYRLLAEDAEESDSVKFARYAPSRPKRLAAIERVRHVVTETRPAPESSKTSPQAPE
jgi:hypothetical protein